MYGQEWRRILGATPHFWGLLSVSAHVDTTHMQLDRSGLRHRAVHGPVFLRRPFAVNDAGGKVRSDAFFNFGPLSYVPKYLRLLTPQESSRWYNMFIKHSLTITVVLALAFMATLALS